MYRRKEIGWHVVALYLCLFNFLLRILLILVRLTGQNINIYASWCYYYKFISMYRTNAPLIQSFKLKLKNNDLWRYIREILIISFLRFLFPYFRHTNVTTKSILADHCNTRVHLPEIMWNRKTSPIWSTSLKKSQKMYIVRLNLIMCADSCFATGDMFLKPNQRLVI